MVGGAPERQGHDGASPAARPIQKGDLPLVRDGDLARDSEPETGSPSATLAAVVEAHESVEDAAPVGGRNARAVVFDLDPREMAVGARGDDHAAGCVSQGVVDQVAEQPLEVTAVAGNREGCPGAQVFRIPQLRVIKVSFPRPVVQGSLHDRDMHSGQRHVPLANTTVPPM